VPTVFDNYVVKLQVNNEEVTPQLWGTAGQGDFENIRVLSYTNTDGFLICFSLGEGVRPWKWNRNPRTRGNECSGDDLALHVPSIGLTDAAIRIDETFAN
jgi:GTPase SAR1 family protein